MSEKKQMTISDFNELKIGKHKLGQHKDKFFIEPEKLENFRDYVPFAPIGMDGDKFEITKKLFVKLGGKIKK